MENDLKISYFDNGNESLLRKEKDFEQISQKNISNYLQLPERYKAPLYVLWDLTYRCNHDCIFCYNNCKNQFTTQLSYSKLKNIANQLIDNEVISVTFGGGEPMLKNTILFQLAKILKGHVWLTLATNGSLLTPKSALKIAENFSAIQISLHGTGINFDNIVRTEGAYKKVIEGLKILRDVGFSQVEIAFVLTKKNVNEFKPLVEQLNSLGNISRIRVQNLIPSGTAFYESKYLYLPPKKVYTIIEQYKNYIETNSNISFLYDDVIDEIEELTNTSLPNPYLHIFPDGRVSIFPHIPILLGNLNEELLDVIWENKGAGFFRNPMVKKILSSVDSNLNLGFYDLINIRPWIDQPIYI